MFAGSIITMSMIQHFLSDFNESEVNYLLKHIKSVALFLRTIC